MTDPGFLERQRQAWSRPPVDDVGYIPATDLLAKQDGELRTIVEQMRASRYGGWRNHGGLWRDVMGLDEPGGQDILDFGCGTGVEALELALAGNRVDLADVNADNLHLAVRVLGLYADRIPRLWDLTIYLALGEPPYIEAEPESFDVFHCNGVLHHIPWARQVMERAHQILRPDGVARLMLYSDRGWIRPTTSPPTRALNGSSATSTRSASTPTGTAANGWNSASATCSPSSAANTSHLPANTSRPY